METVVRFAWALTSAALAGLVVTFLQRRLVHLRIAAHAAVTALAPVLAVAVALAGIRSTELSALLVVAAAGCTAGLLSALGSSRRLAAAITDLGQLVQRIGETRATEPVDLGRTSVPRGPEEVALLASALQEAIARLATARSETATTERRRRQLVAGVSHDLRTPLAAIRVMVEALEDGVVQDRETAARYYRTICREIDRLSGLVDNLFGLSRLQAGALRLHLAPISLHALVSDAVAVASLAGRAKGVDVRAEVASPSTNVELSLPEMARVLRNLLENAIRHTPAGGAIRVQAGVDPQRQVAVVSVRDSCGGIPAADLPRVFEPAYRGEVARTSDGGGGLGLAVARGLVDAHHGEIGVINEGRGCCFTVRLPLVARTAR